MADFTGLSTRWYDLGLQLLEESTSVRILNEIEHNCPNNVWKCCTKVFEKWLEQQPNANWDQLLTALNNIDMKSVAEQIRDKLRKG